MHAARPQRHGRAPELPPPLFLPKSFRLRFGGNDQRVSVVWQRGLLAGVRFQTPIRLPAAKKKRLSLPFFS